MPVSTLQVCPIHQYSDVLRDGVRPERRVLQGALLHQHPADPSAQGHPGPQP